jgi:hypothetical protein
MKLIALSVIACTFFSNTEAQTQIADSLYIVTYTTGNAWDVSKKPNEQLHFAEHGKNLSAMRRSGTIKFGARYADKGIIMITAPSLQAAKEIINADPAVGGKLFNVDIQRLSVFYDGCITK